MTLVSQIAWDDTVLPFQLDRSDIRGRVARLDGVLEHMLEQHDYPAPVEALVAEAALLTAMIGQTIKLRWKLSLQIRGDGPARLVATDYYGPTDDGAPARMRAYASFDETRLDHDAVPFSQIGKGYFAILIDQGRGMTPYQGITPDFRRLSRVVCRDLFRPVGAAADPVRNELREKPLTPRRRRLARGWRHAAAHAQGVALRQRRWLRRGRPA